MNPAANQREVQRSGQVFPFDSYVYSSADRSAHGLDRTVERPAGSGEAIHLDQLIAGTDTGALGRRALHRGDHSDPSVAGIDLQAEAAVITRSPLQMPLQVLALQQRGVGIVQLLQQPPRRSEV